MPSGGTRRASWGVIPVRNPPAAGAAVVYTTTSTLGDAVLRCTGCPSWEVDADGTDIAVSARRAGDHMRDEHTTGEVSGA